VFSASRSRSMLVAAAGAGVLLAAGCSSASTAASSHGTSTDHPLSATTAIQLAAAHAKLATSFTGTMSVSGTGAATLTMAGTMSERTQPSLIVEADFPSMTAEGMSMDGGMTVILDGKTLYMRASVLSSMAGGKSWIEVPFSELGGADASLMNQAEQEEQEGNPLLQTQVLAGATDVRTVGTSTIGGVPVTEYTGSYSVASALDKLPASARSTQQQALAQAGITTANFRIWLDNQQQVRKLIVNEPGSKESVTISMTVTSINQPVSVQLPPASQVTVIPASVLKQ
jgi:hypothetical protein